jgi:hypothetical protein
MRALQQIFFDVTDVTSMVRISLYSLSICDEVGEQWCRLALQASGRSAPLAGPGTNWRESCLIRLEHLLTFQSSPAKNVRSPPPLSVEDFPKTSNFQYHKHHNFPCSTLTYKTSVHISQSRHLFNNSHIYQNGRRKRSYTRRGRHICLISREMNG